MKKKKKTKRNNHKKKEKEQKYHTNRMRRERKREKISRTRWGGWRKRKVWLKGRKRRWRKSKVRLKGRKRRRKRIRRSESMSERGVTRVPAAARSSNGGHPRGASEACWLTAPGQNQARWIQHHSLPRSWKGALKGTVNLEVIPQDGWREGWMRARD